MNRIPLFIEGLSSRSQTKVRYSVKLNGRGYRLQPAVFEILALLAKKDDWMHRTEVLPTDTVSSFNALAPKYIYRLRQQLPIQIQNNGRGYYRLKPIYEIKFGDLSGYPSFRVRAL